MGKGLCSKCKIVLTKDNSTPKGFRTGYGYCKSCGASISKDRFFRLPEEEKDRVRKLMISSYRKREYGISKEQFEIKLVSQNNLCEICGGELIKPCLDHDHITKKIRDILCPSCNLLLGNAKENIKILLSAVRYLQKHESDSTIKSPIEVS